MTLKRTLQRQEQPIHLGTRHGYRIEGDHVFINAELEVPPYSSGGEWTLELWATDQPYSEGPLSGVQVAQLALELPTPIGPHVHPVDARTAARLPLQGRAYAMVLALVQHGPDGQAAVHAFANYARPQTFIAPRFEGNVGYRVQGREVVLEADGIFNPRSEDNLSGTLSLELWAFPEAGGGAEGIRLATSELETLAGKSRLPAVERRVAFSEPPVGRFDLALLLCEWTFAHGYVARDRRDFSYIYESPAPELPAPSSAPSPVPPARSVDRLRLIPPVPPVVTADLGRTTQPEASTVQPEPVVAAVVPPVVTAVVPPVVAAVVPPVVAAPAQSTLVAAAAETPAPPMTGKASTVGAPSIKPANEAPPARATGLVSIQTGSVEDLAKVNGLNLKIAREIVKARPFSSLADLIRVRGLGQKTIDRLKGLVTL